MSIDLEELGKAVVGLVTVVKAIIDLTERMRRKPSIIWKKSDLERVSSDLAKLAERLEKVSSMANSLSYYIEGYVGSMAVYEACDKILEVLEARRAVLNSKSGEEHDNTWAHISSLFTAVSKAQQEHIKMILNRVPYLDPEDAKDIRNQVREFGYAYTRAEVYLSERRVNQLISCIRELHGRAQKLVGIFNDSIFNKLLANLVRVRE